MSQNPLVNNPWKSYFKRVSKNSRVYSVEFGADPSINQAAQQMLNDLGANPPLVVDGVIGPKSIAAIRAFQQDNGLSVTGSLDNATLQKMGLITAQSKLPTLPRIPLPGKKGQTISIAKVRGIEKLSQSDLLALVDTANTIGVQPDWLASVMSFESGFNPSVENRAGSGAVGLIQFMPSTAQALGTSTAALKQMSFQQQLPYVEKYFAPHIGQLHSLEDTYLAVFYPAFIGKSDDAVLGHAGSAVYDQNAGFDRTGKGYVTKEDITSTIRGVLASAVGSVSVTTAVAASIGLATLLGLAGAAWGTFTFIKTGKVWPLIGPWS